MRLRLLLVEDSDDDALLLVRHLAQAGYEVEFERVETGAQLEAALAVQPFDCVISDHNMPGFSSSHALQVCARQAPDLPLIIVSGTIGEELAVDAMQAGARDYVMKDNLSRLVPAIKRELEAARVRSAKREAEKAMEHLAYHDALTGLVNRTEFERRLEAAVRGAHADGSMHSLCYLDLDQFKVINDTCGHVAGDALLRELASVLQGTIRQRDTLARLGGDEFGILLEGCDIEQGERIAGSICKAVDGFQFVWEDKLFRVGCSIGLALVTDEGGTVTSLLSAADAACYAAKDKGRGRVHVHRDDDEDTQQRRSEMNWVSQINHALSGGAFSLAYHPVLPAQAASGAAPGIELLVRMLGSDGREIPPGSFLPAAERYGLAPSIDRWVVAAGLRRLAQVPEVLDRLDFFAINLSAASLSDEGFLGFVDASLEQSGVSPSKLCLEITETGVISNLSRAVTFIKTLKHRGCRFALDDFGSGMCSFAYLKTLPVDFVKIDGAFVRDMADNPVDRTIVKAVNELAHVMNMKTIAEFVETETTREQLRAMGIDLVQGYHVGGPHPIDALAGDRSLRR